MFFISLIYRDFIVNCFREHREDKLDETINYIIKND